MAPVSNDKSIYYTTHVKIGMVNYFSKFHSQGYYYWVFENLKKMGGVFFIYFYLV